MLSPILLSFLWPENFPCFWIYPDLCASTEYCLSGSLILHTRLYHFKDRVLSVYLHSTWHESCKNWHLLFMKWINEGLYPYLSFPLLFSLLCPTLQASKSLTLMPSESVLFFEIYFFESQAIERSSVGSLPKFPQTDILGRPKKKPGTPFESPFWVSGTQPLKPSPAAFLMQ